MKNILIFLMAIVLLCSPNLCLAQQQQEEMALTTYYPAPYGEYDELAVSSNTYLAVNSGRVGIGNNNPQSILDISSTTSGFLPPRMNTTQRNAIASPAEGMTIYNNSTHQMESYSGSPAAWQPLGGGVPGAFIKLAEVSLNNEQGKAVIGLNGNAYKMFKIVFQGILTANGADRSIWILPNASGMPLPPIPVTGKGYVSIVGDTTMSAVWDTIGFYVGRNIDFQNADFASENTITTRTGRKRFGWGQSVFHLANGKLLYHRNSDSWNDTSSNITSLWFGSQAGGTVSGILTIYGVE